MIKMLRAIVDKVDNIQEQMGNISQERISKKELKRNSRDQNIVANEECFGVFISRLHMAEETISELMDTSVETYKTEKQRERLENKAKTTQNKISKTVGLLHKV